MASFKQIKKKRKNPRIEKERQFTLNSNNVEATQEIKLSPEDEHVLFSEDPDIPNDIVIYSYTAGHDKLSNPKKIDKFIQSSFSIAQSEADFVPWFKKSFTKDSFIDEAIADATAISTVEHKDIMKDAHVTSFAEVSKIEVE